VGGLYIKQDTSTYLTDDYEIMLFPLSVKLQDLLSHRLDDDTICADWREGELW